MTIGCMRLCKRLSRMERRDKVSEKDIERVKEIMRKSLKVEWIFFKKMKNFIYPPSN